MFGRHGWRRFTALCIGTALAGCGPGGDAGLLDGGQLEAELDLNDVSFLFPLPTSHVRTDELLSVAARGARGVLLPRSYFDGILYSASGHSQDDLYEAMRVVSARFDPCFPRVPGGTSDCANQIRLVAQPIIVGGGVPVLAVDAPLHLLYELTDDAFRQAHRALFELKEMGAGLTDGKPLDVHPVMQAEGLTGPFATRLNEVILAHCGEQNLTRIASMTLLVDAEEWQFAAADVEGTSLRAVPIARLPSSTHIQTVVNVGAPQVPLMSLVPAPPQDGFETLLDPLSFSSVDETTLRGAISTALDVENPALHTVHEIDCGSCHLATRAKLNGAGWLELDPTGLPEAFLSDRFDLRLVNLAPDDLRNLRAFGYFGATGAWSQRTINESARVATQLSTTPTE